MSIIVSGIDYSFNSPAICIHEGTDWTIKNCTFYYLAKKQKLIIESDQLRGSIYQEYDSQQERFDNLSNWSLKHMNNHKVKTVGLEGYSYGSSSSRLFEIGENTGLLKFKMWSFGIDFEVYAPPSVKKFGCGRGNAGKDLMWEAFIEETGLNLFNLFGVEVGKNWNPVSDIVDAYYICKMRHFSIDKRTDPI